MDEVAGDGDVILCQSPVVTRLRLMRGAGPIEDSGPISNAGADLELLDGEADHVFEGEGAGGNVDAGQVAAKL